MALVNDILSHDYTNYPISMTAHLPPFPVVFVFAYSHIEALTLALTAAPKQGMPEWQPHALGR